MRKFQAIILKQKASLYKAEVEYLKLPAYWGDIGILANHAPLIGLLKAGKVAVRKGKEIKEFEVKRGIFAVKENKVEILIL